ncbi:hypothetical protein TOPH_01411 [Tolypocladium ophioglossoides CBS 100239]|uniref:Uncharacterized protein n=1 Tax=Tolypocladium ophioglossoides (strain CBS 100239) TaxID=1163406 RepID=A0A0L0NHW1_TOLOC|nr:hypothetical protein TOPH_01411 [Tolypocladium ophioglossoides CBS 100239]
MARRGCGSGHYVYLSLAEFSNNIHRALTEGLTNTTARPRTHILVTHQLQSFVQVRVSKMRFAACVIALGSVASAAAAAAAAAAPGFQFPDAVPLEKRQTDDPSYQCHANCGYAIQNSSKDGYCKDGAWLKLLDGCLDCALEYKIWQWYGDKVSAAAKKCGLDATPKPATGGQPSAAPTSTAVTTTPAASSTAAVQLTSTASQSSQQSSAVSTAPTATAPGSTVGSATSSVVPTPSAPVTSGGRTNTVRDSPCFWLLTITDLAFKTASPAPSSVAVSQGSQMLGSSILVAGAAVLFATTWF